MAVRRFAGFGAAPRAQADLEPKKEPTAENVLQGGTIDSLLKSGVRRRRRLRSGPPRGAAAARARILADTARRGARSRSRRRLAGDARTRVDGLAGYVSSELVEGEHEVGVAAGVRRGAVVEECDAVRRVAPRPPSRAVRPRLRRWEVAAVLGHAAPERVFAVLGEGIRRRVGLGVLVDEGALGDVTWPSSRSRT